MDSICFRKQMEFNGSDFRGAKKRGSAAFAPREIQRRAWPCTF